MPWHINRPDLRPQEPRINTQDLWPEHLKSGAVLGVYTFQDLASRSDKCGPQGSLFHSVFKNRVFFNVLYMYVLGLIMFIFNCSINKSKFFFLKLAIYHLCFYLLST